MQCMCCGNDGRPTVKLPTHVGTFRACILCASKFGVEELALEADRLLSRWVESEKPKPRCMFCKSPILYLSESGEVPLWCNACEQERRALCR